MEKLEFTIYYSKFKNLCKLYSIFENYDFFSPQEIYIDEINDSPYYKNKIEANEIKKIFYSCFEDGKKHVITVGGKNFSFLTSTTAHIENVYMISFDVSVKVLKNDASTFEKLFKEVINYTDAFYGTLDSISNSVDIMEKEKEEIWEPAKYIQVLLWGNYFGKEYSTHSNILKIIKSNHCISEKTSNGWYVKLSDSPFDYSSEFVAQNRKKLHKYIKSPTGHHHISFRHNFDNSN